MERDFSLSELEAIRFLEARGYVVRHGRESRNPLSWNRLEPFPKGLDFKVEAVAKLREMITPDIITFTVRDMPAMEPGMLKRVHTATLRIL